ncbi:MAG: penicillin-insensitive murein endopeptidase [Myxococcaceae bacterium]
MLAAALVALAVSASAKTFCDEKPSEGPSRSVGSPAHGQLEGGVPLTESGAVRVLPKRHARRCLSYGTDRLVHAIENAAQAVAKAQPGGAALGVGDIARARGGAILAYTHSHQAGRDADLAFYLLDGAGKPVAAEDLVKLDDDGRAGELRLDVPRTWALVRALLEDRSIEVRWLFVSQALRSLLLAEGERTHAPKELLERAGEVLHQPADAPPHDDHLHLRIRCTAAEREGGCHDG